MKKNNDTPIYTPSEAQETEKKDDNSTNIKEVEYDWGRNPNSIKALKESNK